MTKRDPMFLMAVDRVVNGREVRHYLHRGQDGPVWLTERRGAMTYRAPKSLAKQRLGEVIGQHMRPGDVPHVVSAGPREGMPYHAPQPKPEDPRHRTPRHAQAVGTLIGGYLDSCGITGRDRAVVTNVLDERFGPRYSWSREDSNKAAAFVMGLWDTALAEGRASMTRSEYARKVAEKMAEAQKNVEERERRQAEDLAIREYIGVNAKPVEDLADLILLHQILTQSPASAQHRGLGSSIRPVPNMTVI